MAAPQVAGALALHLELDPAATPEKLSQALLAGAAQGALSGKLQSAPNRFLYTRYMEPKGSFPVKPWDDYYTDAGPWDDDIKYWSTIQYADINGDKKTDVCGRAVEWYRLQVVERHFIRSPHHLVHLLLRRQRPGRRCQSLGHHPLPGPQRRRQSGRLRAPPGRDRLRPVHGHDVRPGDPVGRLLHQ